jgi:hypothetical protein
MAIRSRGLNEVVRATLLLYNNDTVYGGVGVTVHQEDLINYVFTAYHLLFVRWGVEKADTEAETTFLSSTQSGGSRRQVDGTAEWVVHRSIGEHQIRQWMEQQRIQEHFK